MSFGPEWFIVLGIIVLLFGAKKLPELARSMGKASSEFKQGLKEGASDTTEKPTEEPVEHPPAPGPEGPVAS
jgi:sec-independent protein translocase protein TatA